MIDIHGTKCIFHRTHGRHGPRPDRKTHLLEVGHVTHPGVADEPFDATRLSRRRQEIAEISVSVGRSGGENKYIPGLAELNRHMDHPVVAGCRKDCHRRSTHAGTWVDWPQGGIHKADTALCFMNRRSAGITKAGCQRCVCAFDIPNCHLH